MKPLYNSLAISLVLGISATSAFAISYYFDGGTVDINTNGNGVSAAVDGTWNTTLKNWDQGATAHFVWNNTTNAADTAVFSVSGTNSKTVTVESTVVAGKINVLGSAWTFTGGTLDVDVFDAGTLVTDTRFTSNLTGTIEFTSSAGNTGSLGTSAIATINGNNTGLTSTQVAFGENSNPIVLNNAGAFGNASATLNLTKGLVNLGGTSGTSISYNAWATDLAGTIRGRFDTSTWNGATNLTGNSQLMTRNSANVKLIFSSTGTINLNDKTLSLWSSSTAAGIELNGVISGTGNLETGGGFGVLGGTDNANGTVTLNANNTHTGDTLVNNGTLVLSSTGGLKFKIGANGVNNKISGSGTLQFDGTLRTDLSGANSTAGNSWTLVNKATLAATFGTTFTVADASLGAFTETALDSGIWKLTDSGKTWTFTESDGKLTVANAGYAAWQLANGATGQTVDQDHDSDGLDNGIEYFMGESGNGFTANPVLNESNTITWTMGDTYTGTYATDYQVQTSGDLTDWVPVPVGDVTIDNTAPGKSLSYTLNGSGKRFVRLLVNPN